MLNRVKKCIELKRVYIRIVSYKLTQPKIRKPIILNVVILINISVKINIKAIIENVEEYLDKLKVLISLFNINHLNIVILS